MGYRLASIIIVLILSACGSREGGVQLRPPPANLAEIGITDNLAEAPPPPGTLYATLRRPADPDEAARFYADDRGVVMRVGRTRLVFDDGNYDWPEIVALTLEGEQRSAFRIDVASVEEFGILTPSLHRFVPADVRAEAATADADRRFADAIDARLETGSADVILYVHGYRVGFEQTVLIAAEFAHYLGYRGAVVAFSWPSTQSRWAYVSDLDTAAVATFQFRRLLTFLDQRTRTGRIHIIGYSAGTRLVARALADLALEARVGGTPPPIGNVILTGSDIDRGLLGSYIEDGMLDVVDRLTIYLSETDRALALAQWVFARQRVGQAWSEAALSPSVADFLRSEPRLDMINVTGVAGTTEGTGHAYFRDSPQVAGDLLLLLAKDLGPAERGLVRVGDSPIWSFPGDAGS